MSFIDRLTDATYRATRWLVLVMIVLGAFNALARYATRYTGVAMSSNAALDVQWYLFAVVFLLGAAYGLRHGVHVRVDVVHERLSGRVRAWIELVGTVLLAIPFCVMMLVTSWPAVRNSWAIREGSPDPGGLARYPIKTVLLLGFALLLLQALMHVVRQVAVLRGREPEATA
jgi:TRAP-type mannitol/chloroaromatic compound transport system permease small subunit